MLCICSNNHSIICSQTTPCDAHAACIAQGGQEGCFCLPGYTGNGSNIIQHSKWSICAVILFIFFQLTVHLSITALTSLAKMVARVLMNNCPINVNVHPDILDTTAKPHCWQQQLELNQQPQHQVLFCFELLFFWKGANNLACHTHSLQWVENLC